jgi:hypothetical protein
MAELILKPIQRQKDIHRCNLISPQTEPTEFRIARNSFHNKPQRDRPLRIRHERYISRHKTWLVNTNHNLIADTDPKPSSQRLTQNGALTPSVPKPTVAWSDFEEPFIHSQYFDPANSLGPLTVTNKTTHRQNRSNVHTEGVRYFVRQSSSEEPIHLDKRKRCTTQAGLG